MATLKTLTGTGNAYTITLSDTSADIADLIAMNDRTSVLIDARSAATITSASTTTIDLTAAGITWKSGITVSGTSGNDSINATAGDDSITGGAGNDSITAGFGNDTIVGAQDDALLDGGSGSADVLHVFSSFIATSDSQIVNIEVVALADDGLKVSLASQTEALTITGFASGASSIIGGA
ncbi:MAG: hypothetical protein EBW84_12590, partial [Betaproteobacteria bacterium]|nr:hypothetical protein [Betaproteobacteria bacterium]